MPVITKPNQHFDTTTYTGNGGTQSITSLGFQPDFLWIKSRGSSSAHVVSDSVRGTDSNGYLFLAPDDTYGEGVFDTSWHNTYGKVTALNSNGFTVVNGSSPGNVNTSADTYVAWSWKAGSTTVTNTAGSTSAQVRANPTAGFSIVTWTGTGSTATIGHGLGVAPKMIIWMHRTNAGAYNHITYHASLPSAAYVVYLNLAQGQSSDNNAFNTTAPTSSVFTVGGYNNADTMVAYCFAEVADYSKIGSYTGDGSTTNDGPFVYLGFRPKFIIGKRSDTTGGWWMFDTARNTSNLADDYFYADLSDGEFTNITTLNIDILSNGFKVRSGTSPSSYINASGGTYIYMAFAESPFKYANAR
jgi:hypothetical protein